MPLVEVTIIEGRSAARKRALIREVTDAVERAIGAPRETIRVILREVPPAHWGVGGIPKEGKARAGGKRKRPRAQVVDV